MPPERPTAEDSMCKSPAVLRTAPCRSGESGGVHPISLHSGSSGEEGPAALPLAQLVTAPGGGERRLLYRTTVFRETWLAGEKMLFHG